MASCDGFVASAMLLFYLILEYKNNLYTMRIQDLFNALNHTIFTFSGSLSTQGVIT